MQKWIEKVNEINPEGSIIVHGLSMGGGIVLDLADKDMKNVQFKDLKKNLAWI